MKITEIIFVCIAAVLTGFTTYKWKETDTLGKTTLVFVIIAAVLVAINSFTQTRNDKLLEKVQAKIGEIKDIQGATYPKVEIGYGGTVFTAAKGRFFASSNESLLKVFIVKNKLSVFAITRDKEAKPIAVLDENTWTLFNDDYEYNNDETSFEIVTKGERMVYFQIELKNGIVHLYGNLIGKNRSGFNFRPSPNGNGGIMVLITPFSPNEYFENSANKIFKYPRGKFLGVRNN